MADRFDKFTPGARSVLHYAQEEAARFRHPYLGAEHILLGLLRDEDEVAAEVLHNLNIDVQDVRGAIETIAGRGDGKGGEVGLTARAKRCIELAFDAARQLEHESIGTEHLLLGMLEEGQSAAFAILQTMGVTTERALAEIARIYVDRAPPPPPEPPAPEEQPSTEGAQPAASLLTAPEETVGEVMSAMASPLDSIESAPAATEAPATDAPATDAPQPAVTPAESVADLPILRAAPNAELAISAIRALNQAKSALEAMEQDSLAKALTEGIVVSEICQVIELLGLHTYNRFEFEDTTRRVRQAIDVMNRAALALQQLRPLESLILVAASSSVQRALAR